MQVFGSSYCNYHDFKFSFDAKKKKKKIKSSSEWVGGIFFFESRGKKIESEQLGHTLMINSI